MRAKPAEKSGNPHINIMVFVFSGSSKIRAKRVCCCFDMCHYLFEIDANLRTDFCVGCPVTLRTITAKIYLQTSSLHASKRCIM